MGLIKSAITAGAGIYGVGKITDAMKEHDQTKMHYQQQQGQYYAPPQQSQGQYNGPPQQQSHGRGAENGAVYGTYIAPDGTEHVLSEPIQPHLLQQAQRQLEGHGTSFDNKSNAGFVPQGSATPPAYGRADGKS